MSRLADSAARIAAPLLGGYLGVVTLGGLDALVTRLCPALEIWLSPVVAFAPVDAITRDETRVCFALHIEKLHAAVPLKYSFFVEARLSDRIPVAAYLVDESLHRLKNADLVTHPVGERWTRHYCFDLPQTVADRDVRVSGTRCIEGIRSTTRRRRSRASTWGRRINVSWKNAGFAFPRMREKKKRGGH